MSTLTNSQLITPARGIISITPNDSADLSEPIRALIVGVAGDVAVVMADGTSGTLPALAAGVLHPIAVKRVLSTGTTATTLIGVTL